MRISDWSSDVCSSDLSLGDGRLRDAVAKSSTSNDSLRRFESFGARVRRLRLAKTMTQGELANLMSVSVPSVCGWESDRARPRAGRIDKLADILGVGSTELDRKSNSLNSRQ